MLIDELFEKFDTYEKLWIGINDIRDQIVDLKVQDEINFHFVTMDEDAVRGFLHQHTIRENLYAEPKLVSDIYIANSLDENWRRLVAAKELLHILDTNVTRAESNEAVEKLLDNLSLPPEVRQHTNSYFNDQARLISALAILVPKECRVILRRLSSEGIIGASDVSRMAKIPNRFGQMILDDDFEGLFNIIHKAGNGN
jgi:hypothetical protein